MLSLAVSLVLTGYKKSRERKPLLREGSQYETPSWDSLLWEVSEPSSSRVNVLEAGAAPCSQVALPHRRCEGLEMKEIEKCSEKPEAILF